MFLPELPFQVRVEIARNLGLLADDERIERDVGFSAEMAGRAREMGLLPQLWDGVVGRQEAPTGEWVALDPMSVFVGPKSRGMAEIYFDTINVLRENTGKINLALSICNTLKAKAATSGSASLIVSFVNDIPIKMVLKPADENMAKKYSMTFNFAVPVAQTLAGMQH